MDQRSDVEVTERPFMLGIQWMSVRGRSGWCHVWSDGTVLPVLSGMDEPDDTGGDDDDADDDDADDDADDDSDDDDDDDDDADGKKKAKPESKRIKELSDEAARYRVKAKTRLQERDAARTELTTVKAELEKLKKDGGSDETLKARNVELEEQIKTLTKERDEAKGELQTVGIEKQVRAAVEKLDIGDDVEYVMFVLNKNKQLTVDDDGDIEDLQSNLKSHLKSKTLSVVSDDEDEPSDEGDGGASGARRTRSKGSSKKRGSGSGGLDRASLEKKYPALRR